MKHLFKLTITLILFAACADAGIINGNANMVLGQPDFVTVAPSTGGAAGLNKPFAVAVDSINNRVFVADTFNNRVLWWNNMDALASGLAANGVLGQADFTSFLPNRGGSCGANTLARPFGVAVDASGNVWVADYENNRLLRYSGTLSNGMDADMVIGQADFTQNAANRNGPAAADSLRNPIGVFVDTAGALWVADTSNNRTLRYPAPLITGKSADLVLGQPDFASTQNYDTNGDSIAEVITAATLYAPESVFVETQGAVWVADHLNHRFLRYSGTFSNGMNATLVLGQQDFTHGLRDQGGEVTAASIHCAYSLVVDKFGNVWVADYTNNRVLRYSGVLANGMSASQVIGQADFVSTVANRGASAGADTIFHPAFLTSDGDGNLWVCEEDNNRVTRFNMFSIAGLDVTQWSNGTVKEITITGDGFGQGIGAKLVRAGQSDIVATGVNAASETTIKGTFDLRGAAIGTWSMDVIFGDFSYRLANALTIVPAKITSITPTRAINTRLVNVAVEGENFFTGTAIALSKDDIADIPAAYLVIESTGLIRAGFNITGAQEGLWNVVIPQASSSTMLMNGFTISTIKISSVTPNRVVNSGAVDVSITGENFVDGMTAQLAHPGRSAVNASAFQIDNSSSAVARFDLVDVSTGAWSVVLASGPVTAELAGGFDVHFPSSVVRMILRSRSYSIGIETQKGIFIVEIPEGAFAEDVLLSVNEPGVALPRFAQDGMFPTDIAVQIENDKGLQPQKNITLSFFYNAYYVAGLDRAKLAACYCDNGSTHWVQVHSRADALANNVISRTPHLCIFRLVQRAPEQALNALSVYPNPYRPGSAGDYGDPALGEGVVFNGLTARAAITIFTVAGERVTKLDEEDGDGVLVWDTKNDSGQKVASGVYVYFITNPDDKSQKAKGRFAIMR